MVLAMSLPDSRAEAAEETTGKPLRLLIVTGGHDFERDSFFRMFDSFEGTEWREVQHPAANDMYAPEHRDEYDVVVCYDMPNAISDQQKKWMMETFRAGKPWVVMHHAMASYPGWPEFARMIGGKYLLSPETIDGKDMKPSTYRHDVMMDIEIADKDHPITRGMENYSIEDEVYGGFYVSPEVHVLLTTDHPESSKSVAWTTSYGKGRVVFIQGGHGPTAFDNDVFRGLVERSILWAAGRL
jgi:type 1 glutamine amidotransferase